MSDEAGDRIVFGDVSAFSVDGERQSASPAESPIQEPSYNDYPAEREGHISDQAITVNVGKKEAKIIPSNEIYGTFDIAYDNESYILTLDPIAKITKELVTCLTKHAIRLKKNIWVVRQRGDLLNLHRLSANEIIISRFDTEHYAAKTSRIRNLDFPGEKIKLEDIENVTGRRMKVYTIPEQKELIGSVFKDLKNNPIAYMSTHYGSIMLLWNILTNRQANPKHSITYLDYILTNYSAKLDKIKIKAMEFLEQEREKTRKIEYTHFINRMFDESIHAIANRMHTAQQDIDTHMRGLLSKGKELDRDTTFLEKLKNRSTSKEIKDQLEVDYTLISKLRKTNKYTGFRFDGGALVGRTSMIKFFNKYNIGEFDVHLSLNGVVKCYNKTYTAEGDYGHPHIAHGNPCWGNLGDAVFQMLRSNQFGASFDLMYEFLIRYTDGMGQDSRQKPYRRLEEWNPAFLQQGLVKCSHCGRIKELCHCGHGEQVEIPIAIQGICSHCAEEYSHCSCARCPDEPLPDNLISIHIDCNSDCDHFSEEFQECTY